MSKRALLIGINDYKRIKDLRGCVSDVTNVRDVLKTYYGFDNKEIRVLTDARATRENVLSRMEWLIEGLGQGDTAFFHFSGHGSQVRDRDGDELRDWKDEILCCYGMSWDGGYITDDEFDAWRKRIETGVLLEAILDCCHSGTGTPVVTGKYSGPTRLIDIEVEVPDVDSRFLEPPLDIQLRSEGEDLPVKRAAHLLSESWNNRPSSGLAPKHVIWSGCGEGQTSADSFIKGSFNGAFTYYWCKHVRESGGKIDRRSLYQKVRNSLAHHKYTQIPELTCEEPFSWLQTLG